MRDGPFATWPSSGGLDDTRATLRRWNAAPGRVAGVWALGALVIACVASYIAGSQLPGELDRLSSSRCSCRSRPGSSRAARRRFDELLAATVATTAIAAPVLVLTALIEVRVWPVLLRAASPLG